MRIRERSPELMDDPALPAGAHRRALRGLTRINCLSRPGARLWQALAPLARRRWPVRLRVLDVATGAGDVPLDLSWRARQAGFELDLTACDISPRALEFAGAAAASRNIPLSLFACDVIRDPLPTEYDVVTCSLFLHHLADADATALLRALGRAARELVLVDDLRRSRCGLIAAWLGTRALSRSRVVHIDGPRSVRAAFSLHEVRALAAAAGLDGAEVAPHWPWRFLLRWRRS